jgi:multidrug efflux pump subunit AcrA (membrane-fusion protein)
VVALRLPDTLQALCKHVDAAPATSARPKALLAGKQRTGKPGMWIIRLALRRGHRDGIAGAIDPSSRTMQVEVQVPNHDGTLYAGMYGPVKFVLPDHHAPIVAPANAFVFRAQGPQVVTVTGDNRIHWQKISVGRDFGTQLEVLDGLQENTRVVMNATDDLDEGIAVQVKAVEKPKPAGTVAQSSSIK